MPATACASPSLSARTSAPGFSTGRSAASTPRAARRSRPPFAGYPAAEARTIRLATHEIDEVGALANRVVTAARRAAVRSNRLSGDGDDRARHEAQASCGGRPQLLWIALGASVILIWLFSRGRCRGAFATRTTSPCGPGSSPRWAGRARGGTGVGERHGPPLAPAASLAAVAAGRQGHGGAPRGRRLLRRRRRGRPCRARGLPRRRTVPGLSRRPRHTAVGALAFGVRWLAPDPALAFAVASPLVAFGLGIGLISPPGRRGVRRTVGVAGILAWVAVGPSSSAWRPACPRSSGSRPPAPA